MLCRLLLKAYAFDNKNEILPQTRNAYVYIYLYSYNMQSFDSDNSAYCR